jgi:hypothetical membrane protein
MSVRLVRRPAIVSSITAFVVFTVSTVISQALVPGFDSVRQTISELAADDAPTHVLMTIAFVLSGTCHLVTAYFTPAIGLPGRIALAIAGVTSWGVAYFSLPTAAATSQPHRVAAIAGFVIFTFWLLLGMRRSTAYPLIVRPRLVIPISIVLSIVSLVFLYCWTMPGFVPIGFVERACAFTQAVVPVAVVLWLWRVQRLQRSAH